MATKAIQLPRSLTPEMKREILKNELQSGKKASQSTQLSLKSRMKLIRMESAGIVPNLKIQ